MVCQILAFIGRVLIGSFVSVIFLMIHLTQFRKLYDLLFVLFFVICNYFFVCEFYSILYHQFIDFFINRRILLFQILSIESMKKASQFNHFL